MLLLLAGALPTFHAEPGQSESALSAFREEVRAVRDPPHNYMDNGDGEIAGVLRTARNSTRPAGGNLEGGWGTDIYTDDSSICTVAAYAGIITRRDGGTVTIKFVAGGHILFFKYASRGYQPAG